MPQNGPWLPAYQSVWTHRKTFELAALLGLNETYAAAHFLRLCGWALDNAPDGDLAGLSDRAIAFGAGWTQEVSLFVAALVKAGFLDDDRQIHDWYDYAGKLLVRREKDAERKRKSAGSVPEVRWTSTGSAAGIRRTEEYTTEEKRTEDTPPKPPPQAGGGEQSRRPTQRRRSRSDGRPPIPTDPAAYTTGEYGRVAAERMAARLAEE
jgi:hypothetical protein